MAQRNREMEGCLMRRAVNVDKVVLAEKNDEKFLNFIWKLENNVMHGTVEAE